VERKGTEQSLLRCSPPTPCVENLLKESIAMILVFTL